MEDGGRTGRGRGEGGVLGSGSSALLLFFPQETACFVHVRVRVYREDGDRSGRLGGGYGVVGGRHGGGGRGQEFETSFRRCEQQGTLDDIRWRAWKNKSVWVEIIGGG